MKYQFPYLNTPSTSGRSLRGFTIVETLVAIAVLMIAVAGPLVVATKGLTSALVSKDQMVASYLAQDTMETIKNVRDNNLPGVIATYPSDVAGHWLSGLGYIAGSQCYSDAHGCDVNGVDSISPITVCDAISPYTTCGVPLYFKDGLGYTHNSSIGGYPTVFYRHYYFEVRNDNNGKPEVTAHVIVDWNEGTVPYQIHLVSELVATTR